MAAGLALATQLYDIYIPFKFELDEWMDIGQDTGHMWSSQYPPVLYAFPYYYCYFFVCNQLYAAYILNLNKCNYAANNISISTSSQII